MAHVERSVEIDRRADFALLCNVRGVRRAVEVGTDLGGFARQFMENFTGDGLLCVDPYLPFNEANWGREGDLMTAVLALQPWYGRVRFVREKSPEAASRFPSWLAKIIDFVYIDADHDRDAVMADVLAWWNVLSPQGILAGHDYDSSHPGVMEAVNEFAEREGVTVRLVQGDPQPSWYIYKSEPRTLYRFYDGSGEVANPRRKVK